MFSTLPVWFALAAPAFAKDVNQSVTVNLVRATWPAFDGKYERRLAPHHSVDGGVLIGTYNPVSFRSRSAQVPYEDVSPSLYGEIVSGWAGYTFYFKRFERGWFAHADLGLSHVDVTVSGWEARATLTLATFTVGPTLGWKRVGKRGFTVLADLGVGYSGTLGNPKATYTGYSSTVRQSVRAQEDGGFGWLGGVEAGWSF